MTTARTAIRSKTPDGATSTEDVNKYGVSFSVWSSLSQKQKQRYYRRFSEQLHRSPRKDWDQDRLERVRQLNREYRLRTIETQRATSLRAYYRHHAQMLERHKRQYAKERSKRLITLSPDAVYGMINTAVSRSLPRFVRDDVVAAMCLAVLEGQLLVENIGGEAGKFLRSYNREYDQYKTISLDAPLGGNEGLTLLDRLADPRSTRD